MAGDGRELGEDGGGGVVVMEEEERAAVGWVVGC